MKVTTARSTLALALDKLKILSHTFVNCVLKTMKRCFECTGTDTQLSWIGDVQSPTCYKLPPPTEPPTDPEPEPEPQPEPPSSCPVCPACPKCPICEKPPTAQLAQSTQPILTSPQTPCPCNLKQKPTCSPKPKEPPNPTKASCPCNMKQEPKVPNFPTKTPTTPTCNVQTPSVTIYSPSPREMINDFTRVLNSSRHIISHDPDGSLLITSADWNNSKWDGVPKNPCKVPLKELVDWLFPKYSSYPHSLTMRGLRELFYKVKPFKDNNNPTVEEIELWFVEVVNHLRRLLGIQEMVIAKPMLSIISRVSSELSYTSEWNSCNNPCVSKPDDTHCGMFWKPPESCASKYNTYKTGYCEGTDFSSNQANYWEGWYPLFDRLPWSLVFITHWRETMMTEGLDGVHVNPFLTQSEIGFTVWHTDKDTHLRVSHSGPVQPPLC